MGTDHRDEEPLNPAAAAEETGTTGGQTESEGDQTGETTNNSNQSGGQGTGDADAGGEGEPETAAGDHPKEPDQSAPEQSDMTDVAAEPQDSSGGDENEGQDAPTPTFTEIIDDDEVTPKDLLGFDPDDCEHVVGEMGRRADELAQLVDVNTVNVHEDFDEDDFFSGPKGISTLVDRYDLEKAVPPEKKGHFEEEQRYWVNKPYAFVIIFHSTRENEKKYYLIEPHFNSVEEDLKEFLSGKLRTAIKYADDEVATGGDEETRRQIIVREAMELLRRYDLYDGPRPMAQPMEDTDPDSGGVTNRIRKLLASITDRLPIGGEGTEDESQLDRESQKSSTDHTTGKTAETETGVIHTIRQSILEPLGIDLGGEPPSPTGDGVRPEQAVTGGQQDTLTESQVRKLLYVLKRNFIGYERIDGIKHDINVEDISCDGYNSPVFVYHTDYEQIITNVYHGEEELDTFVVKLAQRSGKGISKRQPQVDATLPDGSRAQLTLGREVSDHGTNYTIRQFKDVPFTPIDLINWKTFSLEQMAFLWLCIENHKSLLFAGGTASGKTTSLNAVSLFIPSNAKIVSIEDTREVELPQRNWIASVTRPSFSDDEKGDVDEFDLLEAALRQRPDYIVMGEVRGEEGRTLFQVMSTGHTTYTTFHADSVGEVLKRFTTDPINVSKTMFTALDLVSIQSQTRVQGQKVRRNKELTEVNHYDAENDQINVKRVYQWQAETDEFLQMGSSSTLEDIKFDRGWSQEQLETELFKRRVILAYLIRNDIKEYSKVAATLQAFINDPDTILTLVARGELESRLDALREMESVLIQVDPETEAMVPRPDPDEPGYETALDILERAEAELFEEYREEEPDDLEAVLQEVVESSNPTPQSPESPETTEGVDEGPIVDPTATDATDIGAMETNGRGDMEPAGPEADPEMTDRDPSGADGETTGPDHDEADTTTVVTATTSDTDDTGTAATEEQVLPAELQALDGLGQAYANRLKQAGVSSPAELLAVDIDQLSAETDIATPRIEAWIEQLETAKDDEDT